MKNAEELGVRWLLDRAAELREAAKNAEMAYRTEPMLSVCEHVAQAYRDAVFVLEDAAQVLKEGGEE